ncbi:ATP-binding cassette domain-containing protein [Micropruina sp.]|uniref:ATP-binding cassette domain-containing protein n=1 Tax=Micropruina sp. TaxID=2737536 RepID=UPI0039E5C147
MSTVVRFAEVSKTFRMNRVLEDVNLDVAEGERLAISGPNGSGKSVLLRLMCRLLLPDSGTVSIDSRYQAPKRSFPQEFGILIDRPGFQSLRTGLENLQDLAGIRRKIGVERIKQAMDEVGLDPTLKQRVGQYSLGMKQKLALVQATMEQQMVLLLDEPFNALDETSVGIVRSLLLRLNAEGRTIVFCSHNAADVEELATRRLVLRDRQLQPAG